jgi:xanthine phosphoribosyltransferase
MSKDFPVSWEDIHRTAKALAWKLQEKGSWNGIVAVTRGGMAPALLVARELDIRVIDTVSVASYDHQSQSEGKILKAATDAGDGMGWLVIDDLADTGNTFRLLRQHLPKAHYACLYAKPQGAPTVDTFVMEVSQDTWIYLPWEDQDFPAHITDKIGAHLKAMK